MIRKVGETFKYRKVTLRVEKDTRPFCEGCYFYPLACNIRDKKITGDCGEPFEDKDLVKFVKVEEGGEE